MLLGLEYNNDIANNGLPEIGLSGFFTLKENFEKHEMMKWFGSLKRGMLASPQR